MTTINASDQLIDIDVSDVDTSLPVDVSTAEQIAVQFVINDIVVQRFAKNRAQAPYNDFDLLTVTGYKLSFRILRERLKNVNTSGKCSLDVFIKHPSFTLEKRIDLPLSFLKISTSKLP